MSTLPVSGASHAQLKAFHIPAAWGSGAGIGRSDSGRAARRRLATQASAMVQSFLQGKIVDGDGLTLALQAARELGDRLIEAKLVTIQHACIGSGQCHASFRELELAAGVLESAGLGAWSQRARICIVHRLNQAIKLEASLQVLDKLSSSDHLSDETLARVEAIYARTLLTLGTFSQSIFHLETALGLLRHLPTAFHAGFHADTAGDCQVTLVGLHLASSGKRSALSPWIKGNDVASDAALARQVLLLATAFASLWPDTVECSASAQAIRALFAATFVPHEPATTQRLTHATARLASSAVAPDPQGWLLLGLGYRLVGNHRTAVRCQLEALRHLEALPNKLSALQTHCELALLHEAMGSFQAALAATRTILDLTVESHHGRLNALDGAAETGGAHATGQVLSASVLADSVIELALREIRTNFRSIGNVNQLALRCGVSRRTLEKAFKEQIGCTVATQIRLQRLEAVLGALSSQVKPLTVTAREFGYRSLSSMSKDVKHHTGRSPKEWQRHPGPVGQNVNTQHQSEVGT